MLCQMICNASIAKGVTTLIKNTRISHFLFFADWTLALLILLAVALNVPWGLNLYLLCMLTILLSIRIRLSSEVPFTEAHSNEKQKYVVLLEESAQSALAFILLLLISILTSDVDLEDS